jgi:ribonuclease P/MRP protein subunit POP5
MVVLKNRYMVVEMVTLDDLKLADVKIGHSDVVSAIHESLLTNFGEFGLAASLPSLQVKYVNGGTGVCVIRSSRKQYRTVWAAMTFVTGIRELPLRFNLLDLSGSTDACRRAALQCDSEKLRLLKIDENSLSVEQLEHAESMQNKLASLD